MDAALNPDREKTRVLLVDDDREFAADLGAFLESRFQVQVVAQADEVIPAITRTPPDVVLLDIDLGSDQNGFEVLEEVRSLESPPLVLMLTGDRHPRTIVDAIKSGAYHYVCKPPVLGELINLIERAAEQSFRASRLAFLESRVQRLGGKFVVVDPVMKRVIQQVENVAPTDFSVLLIGESGTGKELVAEHIQGMSRRAGGPYEAINCAAVPETMAEAEFFGHARHGFTDAKARRDGIFQRTNGGTLFLDEIGEMPLSLQTTLLRVLDSGELLRVGAEEVEKVDVRLIAASSTDLEEAVAQGRFKEALYFRLRQYQILVPPLRKRPADIIPLAEHFLRRYGNELGRPGLDFSDSAREYLQSCDWPGNVRDLKHTVMRAVVDCPDCRISVRYLMGDSAGGNEGLPPYDEAKDLHFNSWQNRYLVTQLDRAEGNVTEAARLSGISRESFSRMMRRHGLKARPE